jgi:hypothetical protein
VYETIFEISALLRSAIIIKCIMAQEPWDSDDDGSDLHTDEDSDESDEISDDDYSVKPSPSPSAQLATNTSTGVARLKTTTERDSLSNSEEPLCSLSNLSTMLKELPPTLILGFLDTKSRSKLQLTCKLMYDIVSAFDKVLAVGVFTKSPKCENKGGQLRQDLEECTARHGWLAANDERSYLQRIRNAHFSKYEEFGGQGVRENRYYDTALIADGNLWVLWYIGRTLKCSTSTRASLSLSVLQTGLIRIT